MARGMHRLTVKQVENATPGTALNDGGGLSMRCTANGTKRWVFCFTLKGQKQREMGLGGFPGTTLAQARQKGCVSKTSKESVAVTVSNTSNGLLLAAALSVKVGLFRAEVVAGLWFAHDLRRIRRSRRHEGWNKRLRQRGICRFAAVRGPLKKSREICQLLVLSRHWRTSPRLAQFYFLQTSRTTIGFTKIDQWWEACNEPLSNVVVHPNTGHHLNFER